MGNGSIHPDEKDKAKKLLTGSYGSPTPADDEQAKDSDAKEEANKKS